MMNDSKTEAILFGSEKQLMKCTSNTMRVGEEDIKVSSSIKYLGADLDKNLNFKTFVRSKCKKVAYNLKNIRDIRQYLTRKTAEQLINSLVTSHLDYANSLLAGAPTATIKPLQRLQNQAAKVVLQRSKYSSSTQARCELHWLPIEHRVKFKIACIAHNCIHGQAPRYVSELFIERPRSSYGLRSSDKTVYTVPKTKYKTFGDRSFRDLAHGQIYPIMSRTLKITQDSRNL
jgi:hypothetical protein